MIEALRYFCISFLSWLSYSVPDFVSHINIVDVGTVALCSLAIIIFVRSIGGKKHE